MQNEKIPNIRSKECLSPWWWPGNWLRIVWGVWVDQLWYWQYVRPCLDDRRQSWRIFLQGMLGTLLVTPIYAAMVIGLFSFLELQFSWGQIEKITTVSLTLTIVFATVLNALNGKWGIPCGVLAGMVFMLVTATIATGIYGLPDQSLRLYMVLTTVLFAVPIFAIHTFTIIVGGTPLNFTRIVPAFAIVSLTIFISAIRRGFIEALATVLAFAVGIVLGGCLSSRWVTRQVPDEDTRKYLANPEV
jgi:hypothetical protein